MSLGWNFNMSFFPDGVLTVDSNSNPIHKKVVEEIKTKFPKGDCITLDVSIKNVQGFIPTILLEKAGDIYDKDRKFYINKMAEILPKYLQELESEFNNKKCRDEFEKKRLQDMASGLTKSASVQEQSVLGKNFKEQYIYIGIGAGILLLGLYVVVKK